MRQPNLCLWPANHRRNGGFALIFSFLLLLLPVVSASAATTYTWTGAAADGDFNNADNWTPAGGPPGAGDIAVLDLGGGATIAINVSSATAVDELQFTAATTPDAFTLSGSALTLNASGGTGITVADTSADHSISSDIVLGASQSWDIGNGRVLTVSGIIDDGVSDFTLTKSGNGTLLLSGANTLSGGLILAQGALNLADASALGTGTFTISGNGTIDNVSGGSLTLSTDNPVAFDSNFTFGGTDNLDLGDGAVTIGNANRVLTIDGGNMLTMGEFQWDSDANRTLTVNQGTGSGGKLVMSGFQLNGASGTANRIRYISGTADVDITGDVVNGNAFNNSLYKQGSGTLTLFGTGNSYSGATVAEGGTLKLGASGVIPDGSTVYVRKANSAASTSGIFDLNGFDETISGLQLGNTSTGANNAGQTPVVTNSGGGNPVLTLGGNVLYSSGSEGFENGEANVHVILDLGGASRTFTVSNSPVADVELRIHADITDVAGGGASDLTKQAAGTLFLGGSNSFDRLIIGGTGTADDALDAGVVILGHSNALGVGNTYIRRGTLDIAGIVTDGGANTGALELGNYDGSASPNQAQIIDSVGGGIFTLGGNVTYNASSDPGEALISADVSLGGSARNFTINDSANASTELEVSGDIISPGGFDLTKLGSGVLKLSGSNTLDNINIGSTTAADAGTVVIANPYALGNNSTQIRRGTLDIAGTVTAGGAATGGLTLGNYDGSSGTVHSRVIDSVGGGRLSLGGTLTYVAGAGAGETVIEADMDLGGANRNFTIQDSPNATVELEISGDITTLAGFDFTKNQAGALKLSGSNTIDRIIIGGNGTGGNDLNAGTLIIANPYALGTGQTLIRRGVLDIAGTTTVGGLDTGGITLGNYDGTFSEVQSSIIDSVGDGRLSLGGGITVSGGGDNGGASNLLISADMDLGGANRTFAINDTDNADIELEVTGNISSVLNFNVTKNGLGVLKLSGSNTFGGLTIGNNNANSGGTVILGNDDALGVQFVTIRGSDLDVNGFNGKVLHDLTFGPTTTGPESRLIDTAGGGSITVFSNVNFNANANAINGGIIAVPLMLSNAVGTTFDIGDSPNLAADLTVNGPVSGTFGLIKTGEGTLLFAGTNTYTGDTVLAGGTLQIDYNADVSQFSDTDNLIFNGGRLDLAGSFGHSEVVAGAILNGAGGVTRSSGTSVLNLNTITINRGGTLAIGEDSIVTTDNLNGPGGILDRRITVDGGWAVNSLDDVDGPIVGFTGYTDVNRLGGLLVDGPTTDVRIVEAGITDPGVTNAAAGTTTINSLVQGATGGSAIVDIEAGNILRIGSGTNQGVLLGDGRGTLIFTNGTLTAGPADDTAAALYLQNQNPTNIISVDSIISDNGIGAVTLIKDGVGDVVISGANTFSGGVTVNFGKLVVIGQTPTLPTPTVNPLGTSTVTLTEGSTLAIRDDADGLTTPRSSLLYENDVVLTGNATFDVDRTDGGTGEAKNIRLGALTIGNGVDTITATSGNNYQVHLRSETSSGILLPGNLTFDVISGNLTLNNSGNSSTGNNTALTDGGSNFSLLKVGGGTLVLGRTSLGGVITIEGGTLQLNNFRNNLPGGIVLNSGTLLANAADGVLGSFSDPAPNVQINGGTVDLRNDTAAQSVGLDYLDNATLALRINNSDTTFDVASVDVASTANAFTLNVNRAFGTSTDFTMTLNAPITTHGDLRFNITGANGYSAAISHNGGGISIGGDLAFNPTTANLTNFAVISDDGNAHGVAMIGTGNVTLSAANTFSGDTRLGDGSTAGIGSLILGVGDALQNSTLDLAAGDTGTLSFGSLTSAFMGGLKGTENLLLENDSSAAVELSVGNNGQDTTYSGALGGAGALKKVGLGKLTLTGANSFTGAATVSGGTLELAEDSVLTTSSQIILDSGGTLLLGGVSNDRIGDAVPMNLSGGTFNTGGLSEQLGVLTLSANSTLDMGDGASVINLADSSGATWDGGSTLLILNWTGVAQSEGGVGGGTDQLIFGNSLSSLTLGQVGQIKFQFDWGQSDAVILSNGEVIAAVPEPATVIAVLTLLSLVAFHERRRFITRWRSTGVPRA